jgi:RHS repeat-associated protein
MMAMVAFFAHSSVSVGEIDCSPVGEVYFLLGDHLPLQGASRGSATVTANADGTLASEQTYTAWGTTLSGTLPTDRQYTGQICEEQLGIYFYNARYYDPFLSRFLSPDSIVPDPTNPIDWDRYSYARNNPLRYTDSDGHFPIIPLLIIGGIALMKVIDYGWTAYDVYQSGNVLADPNASREDKLFAGLNVGLAVIFEVGEPDDLLPIGLPLDDVGRRAVMKGAREAFEQGGEEALEKFIRNSLGDYSDEVLAKLGVLKPDPNKPHHIFDKPGRQLDDLVNAFGSQTATYNAVFNEFSRIARNYTNAELNAGIQVIVNGITVTVRGNVLENGAVKLGTFFIP